MRQYASAPVRQCVIAPVCLCVRASVRLCALAYIKDLIKKKDNDRENKAEERDRRKMENRKNNRKCTSALISVRYFLYQNAVFSQILPYSQEYETKMNIT